MKASHFGIGLATVLWAHGARAGNPTNIPLLEVVRSATASECPDASALVLRVNSVTGRNSVRSNAEVPANLTLRIQISASPTGYAAVIVAKGARSGRRRIADIGESCDGLTEALAVTLALIVDDEYARPSSDAPPRPLVLVAGAPRRHRTVRADALRSYAAVAGSVGVLERPGIGLGLGLMGDLSPMQIGVDGFFLPTRSFGLDEGHVDVSLLAAGMSGCWIANADPSRITLCAELHAGSLKGSATGFSKNRSERRPWIAPGLGVTGVTPLAGPIELLGRVQLMTPLRREIFSVDNVGVAHTTPPLGALLSLGLSVSIN